MPKHPRISIADYEMQAVENNRRLNRLVSIAQLPPEILAEIFMFWTIEARARPAFSSGTRDIQRGWHKIAHVCHYWRQVVLNCPGLWNNLEVLADIGWTREMLSRTRMAPLRVQVISPDARKSEALSLVFQELPRIQEIRLTSFLTIDSFSLGAEAPMLTSLIVKGIQPGADSFDLFNQVDMPKLTCLHLSYTHTLWTSPLFKPTLLYLTYSNFGFKFPERIHHGVDMAYVVRVLESMPYLRGLSLDGVIPSVLYGTRLPQPRHIASLPQLCSLRISASPTTCAHFLKHICFPPHVALTVSCDGIQHRILAEMLFPVITSKTSDHTRPLRAVLCSEERLRAWTETFTSDSFDIEHPLLETSISCGHAFPASLSSAFPFPRHCSSLPLEDVESFAYYTIGNEAIPTRECWVNTFRKLTNVRHLHITSRGHVGISEALSTFTTTQDDSRALQPSCILPLLPKLDELILDEVDSIRPLYSNTDPSILPRFCEMLFTRREAGCQLNRLVFRDCAGMTPSDVSSLSGLVKYVNWE